MDISELYNNEYDKIFCNFEDVCYTFDCSFNQKNCM